MTISDSKQTTGSYTADVKRGNGDIEKYAGDEDKMSLYLSDGIWTLTSTQVINKEDHIYRDLTIWFPDDEVIQNKTYTVTSEVFPTPGSGLAMATWWIRSYSSGSPFRGSTGTVTVTLDKTKHTASGSFKFEGESPDHEKVSVNGGEFKLEGIDDGLAVPKLSKSIGQFTANIPDGPPQTKDYSSTRVNLAHLLTSVDFKPAHWQGWSQHVVTG